LLCKNFGESVHGVERRAQVVAVARKKAALGKTRPLRLLAGADQLSFSLLARLDVAQARHHLAVALWSECGLAGHLDPRKGRLRRLIAPDPQLDGDIPAGSRVVDRLQIGRTIGDIDAAEQAIAEHLVG